MDPLDASKHSKFQIRFPEIALLMPNLVRASTLLYNRLRTLFLAEPFWQLLVAQKLSGLTKSIVARIGKLNRPTTNFLIKNSNYKAFEG